MFKTKAPELYLLETLERISKIGMPFYGVYVGMSMLVPANRGYRQLEIVSKLFDPLLSHDQSRLFLLSNKDFVLIGTQISLEAIEEVLYQIKSLFADDPALARGQENTFEQIFFLDRDMDRLKALIQEKTPDGPTQPVSPFAQEPEPFDPEILDALLGKLENLNTIDFIRRQSVLSLNPKKGNAILFQEFYTSILQLQQKLCPICDLCSDKSLFNQLTQTLDRRMLAALSNPGLTNYPPAISLNLNMSTVLTSIFDRLTQVWPTPIIVELQIADIFYDMRRYWDVFKKMKERGHRILIDGLSAVDLSYLDVSLLKPDFIKLFWSPVWENVPAQTLLEPYLNNSSVGVILARCGSEEALKWGTQQGIQNFQGHYIDAVLGALTKNACTFGQECTLASCMACRRALSDKVRRQCVHLKHLDALPQIKVI